MKKIFMAILSILLISGCTQQTPTDAMKFKEEYESLNGKENKSGRDYVNVEIPADNPMVYADADKILEAIKSEEAILYFGFDECPWCRNAVPVLIEAANELEVKEIYYFNVKENRDKLELNEDGTINTIKEMGEDYKKVYDALYDHLSVYEGLNDESIKRIYAPTVVFIKYGKVVSLHEGTVDSQVESSAMTDSQRQELKDIYVEGIKEVQKTYCDSKC